MGERAYGGAWVSGHVVLIGLSGSGKTTVGRSLAVRLRRPLYDTDALLSARAGMPVPELLRADAARFRALEEEIVSEVCAAPAGVIATGGGVVLSPRNRALLGQGNTVVWLCTSVSTLVARLSSGGEERPLLAGDLGARLAALAAAREDLYASCATVVVDTETLSVQAVVARITARMPSQSEAAL